MWVKFVVQVIFVKPTEIKKTDCSNSFKKGFIIIIIYFILEVIQKQAENHRI
jgi:hypothetical protein